MYKKIEYQLIKSRLEEPKHFIQVLMGPRQVGKSTVVKQVLQDYEGEYLFYSADNVPATNSAWISDCWSAARRLMTAKNLKTILLVIDAVTTAESGDLQLEDDKGIWSVAADYATADMLDMMKYYLMWFEWCDGWIADNVWTRAVEIERQHPQKFRELMASSKWYESWQNYRDEYIKWEAKSKK